VRPRAHHNAHGAQGLRSSTAPLPCPRLRSLHMERCKGARSFRLPELSRCGSRTGGVKADSMLLC
jgi:hypothetical protein